MTVQIPESRSYVHSKCGKVTEVGGGDFKNMACPVPGMTRTVCSACGGTFPVAEFKWEDSNEEILSYYARHGANVPSLTALLCSRPVSIVILVVGIVIGVGLGVWSWNALGAIWGIVIGIVSTLVGALASLILWDGITNRLLSGSLGVSDVRCLK